MVVTLQCADDSILGSLPTAARRGFPCPATQRAARASRGLKPVDRRAERMALGGRRGESIIEA